MELHDLGAVPHKLHVLILIETSPRPETIIYHYFCYLRSENIYIFAQKYEPEKVDVWPTRH